MKPRVCRGPECRTEILFEQQGTVCSECTLKAQEAYSRVFDAIKRARPLWSNERIYSEIEKMVESHSG
jgi:hypothetical protein